MSKKQARFLLINPPTFNKFIFEKNFYSKDGLYVMEELIKQEQYDNPIIEIVDFDSSNQGITDLFKKLIEFKPDFVYLNLNEYSSNNFHLCVGIKRKYPDCYLIVGLNIEDKIKNELSEDIFKSVDCWLNYDISKLKINSKIDSNFKLFNNRSYYNIYFYNKTLEELEDEILENINLKKTNFIFRDKSNLDFIELIKNIKNKTKKHFHFILEYDILKIVGKHNLKELKKLGLSGVIVDLNEVNAFWYLRRTCVPIFYRISIDNCNKKFYDVLKKYNFYYLDIHDDYRVSFNEFYNYRLSELKDIYLNESNIQTNLKFLIMHPFFFTDYYKFRRSLKNKTKYIN